VFGKGRIGKVAGLPVLAIITFTQRKKYNVYLNIGLTPVSSMQNLGWFFGDISGLLVFSGG
jgi:hypothetical protein